MTDGGDIVVVALWIGYDDFLSRVGGEIRLGRGSGRPESLVNFMRAA